MSFNTPDKQVLTNPITSEEQQLLNSMAVSPQVYHMPPNAYPLNTSVSPFTSEEKLALLSLHQKQKEYQERLDRSRSLVGPYKCDFCTKRFLHPRVRAWHETMYHNYEFEPDVWESVMTTPGTRHL